LGGFLPESGLLLSSLGVGAMGVTMETFEKLRAAVAEAEADVAKWKGGNKAAGTRVRKAMQDIKAIAQELRVEVLGKGSEGDESDK